MGLLFSVFVWLEVGPQAAKDYLTGFIIEKTLSMDNIFVISLIFGYFAIPRSHQYRVLFWGVLAVWSLLSDRPFCKYLCPLGAGLAIPAKLRRFGLKRKAECNHCKACAVGCGARGAKSAIHSARSALAPNTSRPAGTALPPPKSLRNMPESLPKFC